jgi:hypothetical protein
VRDLKDLAELEDFWPHTILLFMNASLIDSEEHRLDVHIVLSSLEDSTPALRTHNYTCVQRGTSKVSVTSITVYATSKNSMMSVLGCGNANMASTEWSLFEHEGPWIFLTWILCSVPIKLVNH